GTPGVKPNIAFAIGAVDYYNTGEIAYTGQWVQGTFTFNSAGSTSFPINIRNNAPGGGGNDFAIDDIRLTTCLVVLPLDLVSFKGSQEPGGVALTWQTAAEENTAWFVVERSTGNNQFDSIGRVAARSLAAGSTYHFTDNTTLPVNEVIYRLRVVDIDGKVTYSPLVSVRGAALPVQALNLAPNPAYNNATLYLVANAPGTVQVSLWS